MLEARHVRDLKLRGGEPLTAASGLVALPDRGLVVASDERPLIALFSDAGHGAAIRLSDEAVADDPAERKAAKPDLESLALMGGDVVAVLGSGSTPGRERGWLWRPDTGAEEISLTRLYARLRLELPDLNIEGAARTADGFWLAQRGNGSAGFNAIVSVDLAARRVRGVRRVELPEVDGVPLTLSDLEPEPGGTLLFAAVAEATSSTYHDGECVGAAVGRLDPQTGDVLQLERLSRPWKVEGLTRVNGRLLLVADPDDPARAAPLLEVDL